MESVYLCGNTVSSSTRGREEVQREWMWKSKREQAPLFVTAHLMLPLGILGEINLEWVEVRII